MAKLEILPNGNLKISINQEEREEYKARLNEGFDATILSDILEPYSCNGSFAETSSEEYGGMTNSPIIVEEKSIDDDGEPLFYGRAWWFPNYQGINELQELVDNGFVIFEKVPE